MRQAINIGDASTEMAFLCLARHLPDESDKDFQAERFRPRNSDPYARQLSWGSQLQSL
jgi:hypothetical protein